MSSPARPHRRHVRRSSSQSRTLPTAADSQTSTARRRNLYRPPTNVATRHVQVQHWNTELRDLTDKLAEVQQRIQQLETLQRPCHVSRDVSEGSVHPGCRPRGPGRRVEENPAPAAARPRRLSRPIPEDSTTPAPRSRAPSTTYRLPELGLDSSADKFDLHLDDWLHASPPRAPTSGAVPLSPVKDVDEQSPTCKPPASVASRKSAGVRRTFHRRDESANTVRSFDSYTTEAVHVYEASTAAVVRPCVRTIAPSQPVVPPIPMKFAPRLVNRGQPSDGNREGQHPAALVPLPLFAKQNSNVPRPDSSTLQSRSSSLPLPTHARKESRHSQPSPWSIPDPEWREEVKSRPVSEATVIRYGGAVSHSPTPSSTWVTESPSGTWATESLASDQPPCLTGSASPTPRPSFSVPGTVNQSLSPSSFQPARWQPSSPPPTEAPRLDSSCTSMSDPPTPTSSLPKTSGRLNLFPRIQQSSYESLGRRYHSGYDKDPFYTVCSDQNGCAGWPSSPVPMSDPQAVDTTDMGSAEGASTPQVSSSPLERPWRKDHRLREMLSPGVKRSTRDVGSNHNLVRSPRKKLRTFLRRFTPNMGKARYSMPARTRSSMSLEKRFKTPPRLPTRQGSSLPFDEALLGELSKISDRGNTGANVVPSPARRIRNSMHDAAGLTLSKTAATHAHWRAQRSRSSILPSMHRRSRAPTGSTLYSSLSSGPSFHFLPKVDQLPITPVRLGPPPGRHRQSRY